MFSDRSHTPVVSVSIQNDPPPQPILRAHHCQVHAHAVSCSGGGALTLRTTRQQSPVAVLSCSTDHDARAGVRTAGGQQHVSRRIYQNDHRSLQPVSPRSSPHVVQTHSINSASSPRAVDADQTCHRRHNDCIGFVAKLARARCFGRRAFPAHHSRTTRDKLHRRRWHAPLSSVRLVFAPYFSSMQEFQREIRRSRTCRDQS